MLVRNPKIQIPTLILTKKQSAYKFDHHERAAYCICNISRFEILSCHFRAFICSLFSPVAMLQAKISKTFSLALRY